MSVDKSKIEKLLQNPEVKRVASNINPEIEERRAAAGRPVHVDTGGCIEPLRAQANALPVGQPGKLAKREPSVWCPVVEDSAQSVPYVVAGRGQALFRHRQLRCCHGGQPRLDAAAGADGGGAVQIGARRSRRR